MLFSSSELRTSLIGGDQRCLLDPSFESARAVRVRIVPPKTTSTARVTAVMTRDALTSSLLLKTRKMIASVEAEIATACPVEDQGLLSDANDCLQRSGQSSLNADWEGRRGEGVQTLHARLYSVGSSTQSTRHSAEQRLQSSCEGQLIL